jgi:orotate phosphoribosyltransferase
VTDVRTAARARLLDLVKELAVVHGRVTLSSGAEADYYIDLRRVTLHHEAGPLVGEVMLDLLDENQIQADAAGGLTMGADPVGTAMLHAAARRGVRLDAFVVRKQGKAHGLQRRIEGPDVAGRRVVAVAVIVDRDTGAREKVEALGLPYLAAFSNTDLDLP